MTLYEYRIANGPASMAVWDCAFCGSDLRKPPDHSSGCPRIHEEIEIDMSKLGDALRQAGQAARAARKKVKDVVDDVASGAEDVKQAIFDDGDGPEDGDHGDGANPSEVMEMTMTAMDGMAALITIIDDVGDAVTKAEEKYTRKGKAPAPNAIMDAVVTALEPTEGTKLEDGNDSIRAFFRGILYCGAALLAASREDE